MYIILYISINTKHLLYFFYGTDRFLYILFSCFGSLQISKMLPKIEKFSIQQVLKVLKERWNTATALWDNNESWDILLFGLKLWLIKFYVRESNNKSVPPSCWFGKLNVDCITVPPKIHKSQTVDPQAGYRPWSMMK
mgnify:CR=1 FL=1